jgi:hypothetical protein
MIGLASGLEIHHLPRGIARPRTTADRVPTALRRCCGRLDRRVENGIWARHSFLARCVARAYSMPSAGTADAIPQVAARTAVSPLPRDWLWATATAQSRGKGGGGGTSGDRHRQGDCRKSTPDSRPVPKAGTICPEKRVRTPLPSSLLWSGGEACRKWNMGSSFVPSPQRSNGLLDAKCRDRRCHPPGYGPYSRLPSPARPAVGSSDRSIAGQGRGDSK